MSVQGGIIELTCATYALVEGDVQMDSSYHPCHFIRYAYVCVQGEGTMVLTMFQASCQTFCIYYPI